MEGPNVNTISLALHSKGAQTELEFLQGFSPSIFPGVDVNVNKHLTWVRTPILFNM